LDYYRTFLKENKNSYLLLAYKDETPVAGWIFVDSGDTTIYYYWASTSDKKYRNLMAPYLLQWTAIEISKEKWKKIYDFLWIASPDGNDSSLAWVTDFKLKLTKNKINVSKAFIYKNKSFKYTLIKLLKKLKK
jgi:lipid II:glycine glycyltransferase (peptidoglycan interpeptide bridge formation enzyme)